MRLKGKRLGVFVEEGFEDLPALREGNIVWGG